VNPEEADALTVRQCINRSIVAARFASKDRTVKLNVSVALTRDDQALFTDGSALILSENYLTDIAVDIVQFA